jgi:hypothetical protein
MRSRRNKALEQELADSSHLLRAWRQWHREELEQALTGPHRALLEPLVALLPKLTTPAPLLTFLQAQDWNRVDADTRCVVLHEIQTAIIRIRERQGLEPFNDPLPGEQENVFRIIRALLFPAPLGPPPGAQPGPDHTAQQRTQESTTNVTRPNNSSAGG